MIQTWIVKMMGKIQSIYWSEDDGQDTIDLLKSKEKNVALKEKTGTCKTSHMIVLLIV